MAILAPTDHSATSANVAPCIWKWRREVHLCRVPHYRKGVAGQKCTANRDCEQACGLNMGMK
ncbi:hypothetical protein DPMN_031476 [Dreissena polymorpha]|uniref:Uncharacterized protein n=1 Tax=Dreissena polymorpha TaxID=45954 RepID=A0A9D4RI31_DREPO|nr:hypothetical protein DPMN_031476 [Dreissena polymorpha]